MEQPKSGGQENNGGGKKEVSEAERKDPSPIPDPKPSEGNGPEKFEPNGGPKDEKRKEEKNSVSVIVTESSSNGNIDEDNGDGSGSNKSASPPSRSKKSVRWSEELVMESEIPRSSENHGSNPYVAFSSARSDDSSSFNIKSKLFFCDFIFWFFPPLSVFIYPLLDLNRLIRTWFLSLSSSI